MFVFMGNRVGNPPSESDGENEEQSESNTGVNEDEEHSTGEGIQTGLGGAGTAGAAAGTAAGVASGTPSSGDDEAPDDENIEEPGKEEKPDSPKSEDDPVDTPPEPDIPADGNEITLGDEDGNGSETQSTLEDDDEVDDDVDNEESDDRFVYGDIVVDRDRVQQNDVDEASLDRFVVVNLPGVCAYDWEFDNGDTLAERNPHYPPTDDTVIVVDLATLTAQKPSWDEREEDIPIDLLESDVIDYDVFPSLRLKLDEPSHVRDPSAGGEL